MRFFLLFLIIPFLSCSTKAEFDVTQVQPGAYSLEEYLPLLEGKRVGIVANQASQINGVHLVDTLLQIDLKTDYSIHLKRIFSPEHGFSGYFDAGKVIENEEQLYDSIEIVSLYGKNKQPSQTDLLDLDVMLFDLQDVGVRFYTYISTLHYVMEACAESNITLIILDRPNPHMHYIDGPALNEKYKSFVGMHPVPIVYGMSIGEYAKMINGEGWLKDNSTCKIKVIRVKGYNRKTAYNFPVKPSPNLPNMESVLLYPSLCLFEGTQISVGRGTSSPFQIFGHPEYPQKDFSFTPVSTPGASLYPKFENEICYGIDLSQIKLETLRNLNNLNIDYLISAYKSVNSGESFFTNYFELLAGTDELKQQILDGKSEIEIRSTWQNDLDNFKKIRKKYLLYE